MLNSKDVLFVSEIIDQMCIYLIFVSCVSHFKLRMSHRPALQLANFPLNGECSGNPVCWEQTQLTVDATEPDQHYRTLS